MKILCFEGSSDDTFGWFEKDKPGSGDDYDNCANGQPIYWAIESRPNDEVLLVSGQYAPSEASTGWVIGVGPIGGDDDKPIPSWTVGFSRGRQPYSPRLVVEVPDDAHVTHISTKKD